MLSWSRVPYSGMDIDSVPPWSNKELKRLGKAIREGRESDLDYNEVVLWYAQLASIVQGLIGAMEFEAILGGRVPSISARAKTIDTLRQKLIAHPTWQLPSIVDVAGVRVEVDMTLTEQDRVAKLIAAELRQEFSMCASDTRDRPHSGYRALHLRATFPAGRVEIQVRTRVQGEWANTYEQVADIVGREIRYGASPNDSTERRIVEQLHDISKAIAVSERLWELAHGSGVATAVSKQAKADELRIVELLQSMQKTMATADKESD